MSVWIGSFRADASPRCDQRDRARKRDGQQFKTDEMAAVAHAVRDAGERAQDENETAEDEHGPVGGAPSRERQQRRQDPGAVKDLNAAQRGRSERRGLVPAVGAVMFVTIQCFPCMNAYIGSGGATEPHDCEFDWSLFDHDTTPIQN